MSKYITVLAFSVFLASSALAQGLGPTRSTGPVAPGVDTEDGSLAFARAPGASSGEYVVRGGKIIGADPDPNVRLQLLRDNEINS